MGIDELGVDEMGVDVVGRHPCLKGKIFAPIQNFKNIIY